MSHHSLPLASREPDAGERYGGSRSVCGDHGTRGRVKYPSWRLAEDFVTEEVWKLSKSKAGFVGTMSRIHRELGSMIDSKGSLTDILSKYSVFDNAWKGFVDVHERLMEFLDGLELERATSVYEEQRKRRMDLEATVGQYKKEYRGEFHSAHSRSSRSSKSGGSSASRKEKLAMAQLKLSNLKKQQELALQMTQLQMQRELVEAEMEAEQARISLEIQQEELDHSSRVEVGMKGSGGLHCPTAVSVEHKFETVPPVHVLPEPQRAMNPQPGRVSLQMNYGDGSHESIASLRGVEELAKALKQVVCMPKIEYMHFDGGPLKYVSFMHNFETCLERDNPEESRRLQLLIQHYSGKTREAIESCVNLPPDVGYETAKQTLHENFGRAHVIAKAHIARLIKLPDIKSADGSSLLEFARHLEVASRTLSGMGPGYMSELDHSSTLKELNKKLPIFLRGKWVETAGKIIESGWRPKFANFLEFI